MAVLLKNETGRKLVNILARQEGRNLARQGYTPRDLDGGTSANHSFKVSIKVDEATISTGSWRFLGPSDGNYLVAEDTLTLTGATEWVYTWHMKDHSSSGMAHSATEPVSNGDRWIWPLAYCEPTSGNYRIVRSLWIAGDIIVCLPLV